MAHITGTGTSWNLPNFSGELFTADPTSTPLLSLAGGLENGRQTDNYEFATSVLYDFPEAEQPGISEAASVSAPQATALQRTQQTNVVQIHQEVIELSYVKLSSSGRMAGIGGVQTIDERSFQVAQRIIKIARDVEYSFINGTYVKPASESMAGKTRGFMELLDGLATDANNQPLSKNIMGKLFRDMADRGAYFSDIALLVSAAQKQAISALYGEFLPQSRNEGGINITELETDFCRAKIVWDRFVPNDVILAVDIRYVASVFQEVPGKGVFFEEELAKTGAAERIQLFGQIGLAHGPAFLHGMIEGLK